MSRTPAFVPRQELPKVAAIPLMYAKCVTTPSLPGYTADSLDYMSEVIEDLVLYPFGILVRLVKHGDFIVPISNVKSAKAVPNIRWDLNEPATYNPAELRQICEARNEQV